MNINLVIKLKNIGCTNKHTVVIATRVFEDLLSKQLTNIEYFYNKPLETIYFTATSNNTKSQLVFIPTTDINLKNIQKLIEIKKIEDQKFFVVMVYNDRNCAYYQIDTDLINI